MPAADDAAFAAMLIVTLYVIFATLLLPPCRR